ncbi:AlkA N-terminal domain-containing protein [Nitrosomonas sp. HPC101]|uniref:AlkA N-terminal domain-containing protein n=1 Tax=Nitrosomonas sp. HPC101 TaxID=1658667 RepID=UPI001367E762
MSIHSLDPVRCYAALQAHDADYDGLFFVGVSTTRIYCRPVCRVRLPHMARCAFYTTAARAEQDGYRPCLRCRPELAPGNSGANMVGGARLAAERIRMGLLIHRDVEALADELGLQSHQLHQIVEREYEVGLDDLGATQRLLLAKQLLTDTNLETNDIAHACDFSSALHLADALTSRYRLDPLSLRKKHLVNGGATTILLRLAYRPPLAWHALASFLCSRSNHHISQLQDDCYLQTVNLDGCQGWIAAKQNKTKNEIHVQVSLSLLPCLARLQIRLRRLFDLDASPMIIETHLAADDTLQRLITGCPGLRIPGTLDIFELGLRAILGQQITVKAATTLFGRFVAAFGKPVDTPFPGLDRTSPSADSIADTHLQILIDLGLTGRRALTVQRFAQAVVDGSLKPESIDRDKIIERLLALPGIGPWTAQYIAIRALGDSNAFPASDLGLLRGLQMKKPIELLRRTENWQPWRAYGAIHLWHQCAGG